MNCLSTLSSSKGPVFVCSASHCSPEEPLSLCFTSLYAGWLQLASEQSGLLSLAIISRCVNGNSWEGASQFASAAGGISAWWHFYCRRGERREGWSWNDRLPSDTVPANHPQHNRLGKKKTTNADGYTGSKKYTAVVSIHPVLKSSLLYVSYLNNTALYLFKDELPLWITFSLYSFIQYSVDATCVSLCESQTLAPFYATRSALITIQLTDIIWFRTVLIKHLNEYTNCILYDVLSYFKCQ